MKVISTESSQILAARVATGGGVSISSMSGFSRVSLTVEL